MAVTGLTLTLVGIYARDLHATYTIRQLAHHAGKAYPNVHKAATQLIDEGVLTKTTVGHSHSCALNLASDTALFTLALAIETLRRAREHDDPQLATRIAHATESNALLAYHDGHRFILVDPKETDTPLPDGAHAITKKEFVASGAWKRAGASLLTGTLTYLTIIREAQR